ncbi:hypothetical protein [Rhodococcus sp. IEGM 1330]|uniref:hypothetical protein n=1 Tax=Rhodococcus sp. IEGM 1330 TaxID=3082225 RepID=UPI00295331F8|nr:hypothetical protein [Rhodococcus sp. IEGM 1330]MDV8023672.1 hypothetical protein [Rhodococcus sp. IEGM 1330]
MMVATLDSPKPTTAGRSFEARRALGKRVISSGVLILLGITSGLQVMGFTVTGFSGLCLLVAPALFLTATSRGDRLVIGLATIAFAGFIVSSQLNDLSFFDERVIQWASFAIYFVGITVIAGRDLERLFSLAAGIALGSCMYFLTAGLPFASLSSFEELWKYAYAPWITLVGLYVLVRMKVPVHLQAVFLVLLAGTSLVLNFRSHALVCLGSAAFLLVTWLAQGKISRFTQILVVAGIGAGLGTLIPAIARSGIAGEAVKEKTELQDSTGVPAILAGRTESPLSIAAIIDKPIFGWGSADNLTTEVFARGEEIAIGIGFDPNLPFYGFWHLANGATSLHSVLFSSWAEGGVFAAVLPVFLVIAALTVIWNSPRYGIWAAMAVQISVQAGWDLLFSPMSYNLLAAFALLAVVFASRHLPAPGSRRTAVSPAVSETEHDSVVLR